LPQVCQQLLTMPGTGCQHYIYLVGLGLTRDNEVSNLR
jgi:hypothetical protein